MKENDMLRLLLLPKVGVVPHDHKPFCFRRDSHYSHTPSFLCSAASVREAISVLGREIGPPLALLETNQRRGFPEKLSSSSANPKRPSPQSQSAAGHITAKLASVLPALLTLFPLSLFP